MFEIKKKKSVLFEKKWEVYEKKVRSVWKKGEVFEKNWGVFKEKWKGPK